jgi:hypothetical protein
MSSGVLKKDGIPPHRAAFRKLVNIRRGLAVPLSCGCGPSLRRGPQFKFLFLSASELTLPLKLRNKRDAASCMSRMPWLWAEGRALSGSVR